MIYEKCPSCGHPNETGSRDCSSCGASLVFGESPEQPAHLDEQSSEDQYAAISGDVQYNPTVIERYARLLYGRANAIIFVWTLAASVVAGTLAYLAFGEIGAAIAALFGGLAGYKEGEARSFRLKLEAQLALCFRKIEENTRSVR